MGRGLGCTCSSARCQVDDTGSLPLRKGQLDPYSAAYMPIGGGNSVPVVEGC